MKRLCAFFYALPSGREPVREWLKALSPDDRKIVGEDIRDVEFACLHQKNAENTCRRSGTGGSAKEGDRMKKANKKKGKIGSSFDDFLKEDGNYEGVTARAIKRVLARQLDELMRREEISKTQLATRMKTSRAQLDRLLDPENDSVTLGTLARAARAVGRHLRMELV
jgi:DNA-binding Xre family transcriptional regulator